MNNPRKNKNFSPLMAETDATRVNTLGLAPPRLNLPLADLAEPRTVGSVRQSPMSNQDIAEMMMPFAGMKMVKGSKEFAKLLKSFEIPGALPGATKGLKRAMTNFAENPNEKTLAGLRNIYQLYKKGIRDDMINFKGNNLTSWKPTGKTKK